ncbi:DNA mismatch repair endonuclease MutH [Myxococcota bacterium]|nr:DNA mismatch repair endonuclease MutH [Myxococcota bacterium]
MSLAGPSSEAELLARARAIAGRTFEWLAAEQGRDVPEDLRRAKGWVGQLVETALGATASTRPTPDFDVLGVELKTIPIDRDGRPRESTYVCTAPLAEIARVEWEASPIRAKLARVLWIPVEADPATPLARRRVGSPLLWSPSPEEDAILRADFEELASLIAHGFVDSITAHRGRWLQLRPKAKDASVRTWGLDDAGAPERTLPRGYYLRRTFTERLLERYFAR